jgi:transposase
MAVRKLRKTAPFDFVKALPRTGPTRWSATQKAAVVLAVRSGTISPSEAHDRYMLSEEELSRWEEAFDRDGIAGLQAKSLRGVPSRNDQRRH